MDDLLTDVAGLFRVLGWYTNTHMHTQNLHGYALQLLTSLTM